SDVRKARAWVRARLPRLGRRAGRGERVLGRLFQARERARGRTTRSEAYTPPERVEVPRGDQPVEAPEPATPAKPSPGPSSEDTLARLREAKKRARREE
ncbi:MAG: hypothetical protein P8Y03_27645, partial [Anaerolineales bacterium]